MTAVDRGSRSCPRCTSRAKDVRRCSSCGDPFTDVVPNQAPGEFRAIDVTGRSLAATASLNPHEGSHSCQAAKIYGVMSPRGDAIECRSFIPPASVTTHYICRQGCQGHLVFGCLWCQCPSDFAELHACDSYECDDCRHRKIRTMVKTKFHFARCNWTIT